MPSQLALSLCTGFVLVLLWFERRGSREVSPASWVPTIWMLLLFAKPLGVWFGSTGDNESGSGLDRLALLTLAAAGLAILAARRSRWPQSLSGLWPILVVLGYMFVSTLWSDITLIAIRRWSREAIVLLMALVVVSEARPEKAVESILRRSAYVHIPFSLLLIKYYPRLGVDYGRWSGEQMWIGVTVHKNTLGRLCLVSAFFLLWALYTAWKKSEGERDGAPIAPRYRNWADVSILLLALHLLRGAESAFSATSVGTLLAGCLVLVTLLWFRRYGRTVPQGVLYLGVLFLAGYGVSAPLFGSSALGAVSSLFGRSETLTGRTDTWEQLVPVVKQHAILGHGFESFWTTARQDFYMMSHAHNGYLDILLTLGAVGFVLYLVWLLACAHTLHRALGRQFEFAALGICLLVMALIYNFTESALANLSAPMTATLVLASIATRVRPVSDAPRRRSVAIRQSPPEHPGVLPERDPESPRSVSPRPQRRAVGRIREH